MNWLPPSFVHPLRLDLPCGLHLRPIKASDVDIDYPAVMGSRERLWERFGATWAWPPADLTIEHDYADLARHERAIAAHESFNYAVLDAEENAVLGCVYIDPVRDEPDAALAAWWVVDLLLGSRAEEELDAYVRRWLDVVWPFARVELPFNPEDEPAAVAGANLMVDLPEEPVRTPLPEPDRQLAERMWAEYVEANPTVAARTDEHPVEMFGDSVEFADLSIGAVLRGLKTGTASLVVEYAEQDEPLPRIGGHWICCDGSGAPRAVLRTVSLDLGAIETLTDAFAWDEGENDRTRAGWLAGHRRYWQRTRAAAGAAWSEDLEVVFERVRVVWPPEAAERAAGFARAVASRPLP